MVTPVRVPGVGESPRRSPRDGHDETRSSNPHDERSQPATGCSARSSASPERQSVSDRQDLSPRSVSQALARFMRERT